MTGANSLAVVLCFDRSYLQHACATLETVVERGGLFDVEVCLLVNGLTTGDLSILERARVHFGSFHMIEFSEIDGELPSGAAGPAHVSDAAYLRLWAPLVFGDVAEYLLYLDADVLCVGDLSELQIGHPLEGNPLGAVQDSEIRSARHIRDFHVTNRTSAAAEGYFNSGVLLIHVPEWRRYGISEAAIDMAIRDGGKFPYGDQDVLNIVVGDRWARLSPKFNCMDYWRFGSDELALATDVRLVHAAGRRKYWHPDFPAGFRRDLYWAAIAKTGVESGGYQGIDNVG